MLFAYKEMNKRKKDDRISSNLLYAFSSSLLCSVSQLSEEAAYIVKKFMV